jgi:hypothetical protein
MTMQSDLLFYFNNNLFMSSNMFSTLQGSSYVKTRPYMGGSTFDENISDGELRQVRKYNKICRKFALLDSETRRQLTSLFDLSLRYPPQITSSFNSTSKRRAGLALWYAKDMEELLKLCQSRQKVQDLSIKLDKRYEELEQLWSKTPYNVIYK